MRRVDVDVVVVTMCSADDADDGMGILFLAVFLTPHLGPHPPHSDRITTSFVLFN